jgi:hypothetical protein
MGRPRSPNPLVVVTMRMTQQFLDLIDAQAGVESTSRNNIIARWLVWGYAEEKRKADEKAMSSLGRV